MNRARLKPCPLCGHRTEFYDDDWVVCSDCCLEATRSSWQSLPRVVENAEGLVEELEERRDGVTHHCDCPTGEWRTCPECVKYTAARAAVISAMCAGGEK